MQLGAIAFIDCLGFKGIWRRHGAETVLAAIDLAEQRVRLDIAAFAAGSWTDVQVVALSDTIVIGVTAADASKPFVRGATAFMAAFAANQVAKALINAEAAIPVRGCICFGEFVLTDKRIIGQAVDEAAELHELANGAFTWIHPGLTTDLAAFTPVWQQYAGAVPAEQLLAHMRGIIDQLMPEAHPSDDQIIAMLTVARPFLTQAIVKNELIPYHVPLKGGEHLECFVTNPLSWAADPKAQIALYAAAMNSPSIDVVLKCQNTLRFLRHVVHQTAALQAEWEGIKASVPAAFPGSRSNR